MNLRADTDQFLWAGRHLAVADKSVQRVVKKELRTLAKPVGEKTLSALADAMPKGGGLAERIRAQGKVSVLTNLRNGVNLQLKNAGGMFMSQFESGSVRHPVYGRWLPGQKPQTVPAGKGVEQFKKEAPALAEQVAKAATDAFWREVIK